MQGYGVYAAGEGAPAGRQRQVVGTGEAGDAVQENDDVAPALHKPPGPLHRHLSDPGLLLHGVIEGGGQHLRLLHGTPPVGDLLRTLADEEDDDVHVLIVISDRVGDSLEEDGLAGLGRRHDEPALAAPDGGNEVDHAGGEVALASLQVYELVREDGGELLEVGAALGRLRIQAVDGVHPQEAVVLLGVLGRADGAHDVVTGAQGEATDLGLGDVNVAEAGAQAVGAEEAVAIGGDLQDATGEIVPLPLSFGLKDAEDKILLAQGGGAAKAQLLGHL